MAAVMIFAAAAVHAQTRDDIRVYVPRPVAEAGGVEQQNFFEENFKAEVSGAGYGLAENISQGDYTLQLTIKGNEFYEDYEGEEQYDLLIQLLRNSDGVEMVQFTFPFTELEEMYEWNLYLVYQALANVPMTKLTAIPKTDHWRNKWLYVGLAGGIDVSWIVAKSYVKNAQSGEATGLGYDQASLEPAVAAMIEYHFLKFVSAEIDAKLRFYSLEGYNHSFAPSLAAVLKGVLKPSDQFMLELYGGVEFPMATSVEVKLPVMAVLGGIQLGIRGGEMGALFMDISVTYDLGNTKTSNNWGNGEYHRFQLGVMMGYKLGFFDKLHENLTK
ncbi:MAG: hypothetical protein LBD31_03730 [Treponema sp.]|nr:hypothetical protein [Treponema sp.]